PAIHRGDGERPKFLAIQAQAAVSALASVGILIRRDVRPRAAFRIELPNRAVGHAVRADAVSIGDVENSRVVDLRLEWQKLRFRFPGDGAPRLAAIVAAEKMMVSRIGRADED